MSALSSSPSGAGAVPAMPREIEALRALLDVRLAALEAALADPNQYDSLEQLIFDLARVATEEADATARRAYLDAQRVAQGAIATARAEGRAALEAERATIASLRQELERAQAALQTERMKAAERDRDFDAARLALEQEQTARATLRREFEEARAGIEADATAAAAALRQGLEQAQAALQTEQAATAAFSRDLDAARAVEAELRDAVARLERELAEARRDEQTRSRTLTQAQTDLTARLKQAEARAESSAGEGKKLADELDAVKKTAKAAEDAARTRYEELRGATEQQIRRLELAVKEAEARADAAAGELDRLRRDASHPPAPAAKTVPAAVVHPPAPSPAYPGLERQASRHAMSGEVEIQVDGSPAWILDLSLTGAQVISSTALKPNRPVKVTLPLGDRLISCKGKIVWARIDAARKGGPLRYRAGIAFTNPDEAALNEFLSRYARP